MTTYGNGGRPESFIEKAQREPITAFVMAVCLAIWIYHMATGRDTSWEAVRVIGLAPAEDIWRGYYVPLFASSFVHFDFFHIAFNLWWFWSLGQAMSRLIGWWQYLLLIPLCAVVTASWQLALSDTTGHGLSGVVYALFGYLLAVQKTTRHRFEVLHPTNIKIMVGWLFLCIVLDRLGAMSIANAAHFSGIVIGGLLGLAFHSPKWRIPGGLGAAITIGACVLFQVWCPWSPTWLWMKGGDTLDAGELEQSKTYFQKLQAHYDKRVADDPQDGNARENGQRVRTNIGIIDAKIRLRALQDEIGAAVPDAPPMADEPATPDDAATDTDASE